MNQSRVRVFLIFWIFVCAAVGYLDRTNITVAGVSIMAEYHFDKQHLGYIFSALLAGYAIFQVPAGWLAGRYGPRAVLTFGVLWWCVLTVVITLISPATGGAFSSIMAVRFLLGVGEAVMYPSANQFTSTWIPSQERGKANGLIFAGVGVGSGVTPPLVNWLMHTYGWRSSFWVSASVGLIAALVWWLCARDKPEQHSRVSPGELAHIEAGLPQKNPLARLAMPWGRMLSSKDVWAVSIAYFGFGYVAFIFLNWFFIYLADARGLKLNTSAVYAMMPPILMTLGCFSGGVASDWLTRTRGAYAGRCVFSAIAFVFTAIFLVLGAHASDPLIATIVLAGGAGALYVSQSPFWALSADFGGPHSGVVSGFMNTLCQIAGVITASLTPAIGKAYGWEYGFYVAAGFALMSAGAWLLVDPRGRLHPEDIKVTG